MILGVGVALAGVIVTQAQHLVAPGAMTQGNRGGGSRGGGWGVVGR
jgi:hypothetical protein